ncbi:MAG: capsule assembly Wzi family protein, partial [Gemmatimonadota bacterium]|nr:capsule assembly Wzi family protein [Gemmatimonadota bacterium]
LALSAGVEPVGYGPGRGGGIVFSGGAPLPRVQVQTTRPLLLPGWLRFLGPVSGHTSLTRLDEARHPGDPFLLGMRAAIRPHPRFTAAVNRGSIFGGDSVSYALNARNVVRMLLGMLTYDFENQVVSADFTFRAPTERVLPLTLYLEWGAEDAAGAWWDVPARVVGAFTPAVPGAPQLSLGAEYTHFSLYCCGNPPWYLHAGQRGGWAARDVPLGHPLGGEGREVLLYGGADLLGARLRLDGRAFQRERGREGYDTFVRAGNLFAPERAGTSHGVQLDGSWRFARGTELRVSGVRELGERWAAHQVSIRMLTLF